MTAADAVAAKPPPPPPPSPSPEPCKTEPCALPRLWADAGVLELPSGRGGGLSERPTFTAPPPLPPSLPRCASAAPTAGSSGSPPAEDASSIHESTGASALPMEIRRRLRAGAAPLWLPLEPSSAPTLSRSPAAAAAPIASRSSASNAPLPSPSPSASASASIKSPAAPSASASASPSVASPPEPRLKAPSLPPLRRPRSDRPPRPRPPPRGRPAASEAAEAEGEISDGAPDPPAGASVGARMTHANSEYTAEWSLRLTLRPSLRAIRCVSLMSLLRTCHVRCSSATEKGATTKGQDGCMGRDEGKGKGEGRVKDDGRECNG